MAPETRMKEITDNLKRDVKDLLGESASLFTGFFKRGVCTVRAVADKWKAFAHDISAAVDDLMKPPFAEGGPEAPDTSLTPESEPIVTITESVDEHFPIGKQMPLSQAEEYVRQMDQEYREAERTPQAVKVKIDYMKDGRTDRYWLPLEIGAGGSLLEQMQEHLDAYRTNTEKVNSFFADVPEEYRDTLQQEFTPFLLENLKGPLQGLLHFFQRHCDIAVLENKLQTQVMVFPEKEQGVFLKASRNTIAALRHAANTGISPAASHVQQKVPVQQLPPQEENLSSPDAVGRSRISVKSRLNKIKKERSYIVDPIRLRHPPER